MASFVVPEPGSDSYGVFQRALLGLLMDMEVIDDSHETEEDETLDLVDYFITQLAKKEEQQFIQEAAEFMLNESDADKMAKRVWDW
jgi:hemerythrin